MYSNENDKVLQIIRWIRGNMTNQFIWDILCGENWFGCTVEDCIDMLEETAEAEMYQFAVILIAKLSKCKYMEEVITNIIVKRIDGTNPDIGIITECIKEFKAIANQKGIMKNKIDGHEDTV